MDWSAKAWKKLQSSILVFFHTERRNSRIYYVIGKHQYFLNLVSIFHTWISAIIAIKSVTSYVYHYFVNLIFHINIEFFTSVKYVALLMYHYFRNFISISHDCQNRFIISVLLFLDFLVRNLIAREKVIRE